MRGMARWKVVRWEKWPSKKGVDIVWEAALDERGRKRQRWPHEDVAKSVGEGGQIGDMARRQGWPNRRGGQIGEGGQIGWSGQVREGFLLRFCNHINSSSQANTEYFCLQDCC